MAFRFYSEQQCRMRMRSLLALVGVLLVGACTAPNDVDTPRKVQYTDDEKAARISATNVDAAFRPLSTTLPLPYEGVWQRAEIDTTGNGTLWLHGVCKAPANAHPTAVFPLKVFNLHCEGLQLSSGTIALRGDTGVAEGTTVTFGSFLGTSDVEYTPDGTVIVLELNNVVFDKQMRTINSDIYVLGLVDGRGMAVEGTLSIQY